MKHVLKITILIIALFFFLSNKVEASSSSNELLEKTYPLVVTTKDYNTFSKDKNFIIFLIDCVDSRIFNKVLNKSIYKDSFKDFTYYPDTASYYLYTRESIPLILTGIPNYNEEDYKAYYKKAFDNSPLFDELIKKDYDINIYDHELKWSTEKGKVVSNVYNILDQNNIDKNDKLLSFKCSLQFVGNNYFSYLFKLFPQLKDISCTNNSSSTNNENIEQNTNIDYENMFSWDDIDNYKYMLSIPVKITNKKQFKFIHVNGSHRPYNIDKDLNRVSESKSSYETEVLASIKLVNEYINILKENNAYDNSVFIIMADHGFAFDERIGRQNPVFLVKGFNETNEQMNVSDKKVSHIDLIDAYKELLNGSKSTDLFSTITDDRIRTLIYYVFQKEDHMVEYNIKGHAWENSKLVKTGKIYNR